MQIPRKHFQVVHAIFKEHDADGDGLITREEFVKAVQRLESRDYVGRQIVRGCHSETRSVRPTAGECLEKHAIAMHDSATRKKQYNLNDGINLVQFVALYFPYLPEAEVARACHHYTYKPPKKTKREKTLDDVEGAREEIATIFQNMDTDHDGFVRVKSLEPMFHRIGLTNEDTHEWLQNLPSAAKLDRRKSKLDALDLEHLLAPTYIAQVLSPEQPLSREQLERQMEWNREIYVDIIGGR